MNLAELMAEHGLYMSLCRHLGDTGLGTETANLETRATARSPKTSHVYFLVFCQKKDREKKARQTSLVVPMRLDLRVSLGNSIRSSAAPTASDLAGLRHAVASCIQGVGSVPPFTPRFASDMPVDGRSWQLGFALAMLGRLFPQRRSSRVVCATGRLDTGGTILPVGRLEEKIAAVRADCENLTISGQPPLLLVPPTELPLPHYAVQVSSLQEAAHVVLGQEPLELSPFKGIKPYGLGEGDLLRERGQLRRDLVKVCERATGPLLVLGPSGSGKSSLLAAGLATDLSRGGVRPVLVQGRGDPYEVLADALTAQIPGFSVVRKDEVLLVLREHLSKSSESVTLLYDDALMFYTGSDVPASRINRFSRSLERLVASSSELRMALACRHSDAAFASDLFETHEAFVVKELPRRSLESALRYIARTFNYKWTPDALAQLLAAAYSTSSPMPVAQYMARVIAERTDAPVFDGQAIENAGGVQDLIAQYADAAFGKVPKTHRRLAMKLLVEVARSPEGVTIPFLREATPQQSTNVPGVIQTLIDVRLLTTADDDAESVSLFHPQLGSLWAPLSAALLDDPSTATLRREYLTRASLWEANGRPDDDLLNRAAVARYEQLTHDARLTPDDLTLLSRSRRRVRRVTAAVTGLLLGVVLAGLGLGYLTFYLSGQKRELDQTTHRLEQTQESLERTSWQVSDKDALLSTLRMEIAAAEASQQRLLGENNVLHILLAVRDDQIETRDERIEEATRARTATQRAALKKSEEFRAKQRELQASLDNRTASNTKLREANDLLNRRILAAVDLWDGAVVESIGLQRRIDELEAEAEELRAALDRHAAGSAPTSGTQTGNPSALAEPLTATDRQRAADGEDTRTQLPTDADGPPAITTGDSDDGTGSDSESSGTSQQEAEEANPPSQLPDSGGSLSAGENRAQ